MNLVADTPPDDPGTLKTMLIAERLRAERLVQIIKELQRHRFGRRAETLPEDQLLLGLEEVEQGVAADEAAEDTAAPALRTERAAKRRANRGSLPAHLRLIETVVDIEDKGLPMHAGMPCMSLARTSPSASTSFLPSSACSSPAAHATAADPAKGSWSRRRHRRG